MVFDRSTDAKIGIILLIVALVMLVVGVSLTMRLRNLEGLAAIVYFNSVGGIIAICDFFWLPGLFGLGFIILSLVKREEKKARVRPKRQPRPIDRVIVCPYCQDLIPQTSTYCPSCGARREKKEPRSPLF